MSSPHYQQPGGYPPPNGYNPYQQPPPHSPQPHPNSPHPPPHSPHPPPHTPTYQYPPHPVPQQVQYTYYPAPTAYTQEAHYTQHSAPVLSQPHVYCMPPSPHPYPPSYPPPSPYGMPSPGPVADAAPVYYPPPLTSGPHMSPHTPSPIASPMLGQPYSPGSPRFYNSYGENPYAVPPPVFTWIPAAMPTPYYPPPSAGPALPAPPLPPRPNESLQPTPPPRPSQPPPEAPSRTVEVFYSPLTGLIQSVSGAVSGLMSKLGPGEKKDEANPVFSDVRTFKCYEIALDHVHEVFGEHKFGWNRKYDAAQRIFGSTVESRTLREGIHLQNVHYYSRDYKLGKGYDKWAVRGGNELLQRLDFGHYRGYIHHYTYVITSDGRWRFSRTGKDVMRDLTSKHAMHADCAEEVCYAGEFVIVPRPEGGYHLVIDNNSGTYAPDGQYVHLVAELLRKNFPGLAVVALDREDHHHKQVTDWVTKNNTETTSKRGVTF